MTQPGIRASDADRENTVAALQREVGTGRLTVNEFSERAEVAYRARTVGELDDVTRDLPRPKPAQPPKAHRVPGPALAVLALLIGLTLIALTDPMTASAMMGNAGQPCH